MQLPYSTIGLISIDQLIDWVPYIKSICYYNLFYARVPWFTNNQAVYCLKRRTKRMSNAIQRQQKNNSTQH